MKSGKIWGVQHRDIGKGVKLRCQIVDLLALSIVDSKFTYCTHQNVMTSNLKSSQAVKQSNTE